MVDSPCDFIMGVADFDFRRSGGRCAVLPSFYRAQEDGQTSRHFIQIKIRSCRILYLSSEVALHLLFVSSFEGADRHRLRPMHKYCFDPVLAFTTWQGACQTGAANNARLQLPASPWNK